MSFLEHADPRRLPLHGGDATQVTVSIDYDVLTGRLAETGWIGDQPLTAGEVRRLACTAEIIPAILGSHSEVLDLGRSTRLFRPHQRRALAISQPTCRAEGCDIPAPWCEAHHHHPWAAGGRTDLAEGTLLCSHHHHLIHDHRYTTMTSAGRIRFRRRP